MTINVGFDFGTSSTKVAYRNLETEKQYYFVFDEKVNDLKRYTYKSTLRFFSNKIYFNDFAGGQFVKLFKLNITDDNYEIYQINKTIPGYYLVVIYCAFILNKVNKFIKEKHNVDNIIYNFGVPIDNLVLEDNRKSKKERLFKLAFDLAVILSNKNVIYEGCNIEETFNIISETEKTLCEINKEDDIVTIYPETLAGVASLLSNNTLEKRFRYSIIDIGAGTTDISFFEFSDFIDESGKFYIYSSNTIDKGDKNYNEIIETKKTLKKVYKKSFSKAYAGCPEKWEENFKYLCLGGGSRSKLIEFIDEVELTIKGKMGHRDTIEPKEKIFPLPNDISDSIDELNTCWKKYFYFLAIAYGLSYPKELMPNYNPQVSKMPKEVLKQSPDEPLTPDVG